MNLQVSACCFLFHGTETQNNKLLQLLFSVHSLITTYILHIEEYVADLLLAGNVKQLFCTVVCSLMM
jgi:hypothetical protein